MTRRKPLRIVDVAEIVGTPALPAPLAERLRGAPEDTTHLPPEREAGVEEPLKLGLIGRPSRRDIYEFVEQIDDRTGDGLISDSQLASETQVRSSASWELADRAGWHD